MLPDAALFDGKVRSASAASPSEIPQMMANCHSRRGRRNRDSDSVADHPERLCANGDRALALELEMTGPLGAILPKIN
jgi:hypothetical protein